MLKSWKDLMDTIEKKPSLRDFNKATTARIGPARMALNTPKDGVDFDLRKQLHFDIIFGINYKRTWNRDSNPLPANLLNFMVALTRKNFGLKIFFQGQFFFKNR